MSLSPKLQKIRDLTLAALEDGSARSLSPEEWKTLLEELQADISSRIDCVNEENGW